MLNWRLNPGAGIAELALGLAVARDLRTCRECATTFVSCEVCDRSFLELGLGRWWAIGRWAGVRCPGCSARLPLIQNVMTRALLPRRSFPVGRETSAAR